MVDNLQIQDKRIRMNFLTKLVFVQYMINNLYKLFNLNISNYVEFDLYMGYVGKSKVGIPNQSCQIRRATAYAHVSSHLVSN